MCFHVAWAHVAPCPCEIPGQQPHALASSGTSKSLLHPMDHPGASVAWVDRAQGAVRGAHNMHGAVGRRGFVLYKWSLACRAQSQIKSVCRRPLTAAHWQRGQV